MDYLSKATGIGCNELLEKIKRRGEQEYFFTGSDKGLYPFITLSIAEFDRLVKEIAIRDERIKELRAMYKQKERHVSKLLKQKAN